MPFVLSAFSVVGSLCFSMQWFNAVFLFQCVLLSWVESCN